MAKVLYLVALTLATIIVAAFGESSWERCHSKIPVEHLNHCQMHLTADGTSLNYKIWLKTDIARQPKKQQQYLQACCNQLKNVDQRCQCDAIQQVFDEARQQGGVVQMRQMLRKAQNLPRDCELDVEKCPLVAPA